MSQVEQVAIERSGEPLRYEPTERMGVIVVESFPALGTLTAARFLEWVQTNPEGVVSLPTGRTPEFFIKETRRLLDGWDRAEVREELSGLGIDPGAKPSTRGLRFVQIDDFYPINPMHSNSFYQYVQKFYVDGFGLEPARGLFIRADEIGIPDGEELETVWGEEGVDLSLRYRLPTTRREEMQQRVIREVDQWCAEYEERIKEMGGIGFFLGGIGPDGHVGFNVRGADPHSTTRLAEINYETKAAAAGDLGGIEVADRRLVITIGLATITARPDAVAIIMAAGEAKAGVVADAVEREPHVDYPATALHALPGARCYLTEGAAIRLVARRVARLERELDASPEAKAGSAVSEQTLERVTFDVAIAAGRRLRELDADAFDAHPEGRVLLRRYGGEPEGGPRTKGRASELAARAKELGSRVADRLEVKIRAGMELPTGTVFLHTEPHHDDIMLGYMPYVVRTIRDHSNTHHFATLTSGFTSVTNAYMLELCRSMAHVLDADRFGFRAMAEEGYFNPEHAEFEDYDVLRYLDGIAAQDEDLRLEGTMRRLLRNLVAVFEEIDPDEIRDRVQELVNYFETQYPGKKDLPHIQTLKGMMREWESACLWGYFGWDSASVDDLRLGFYQGEIFTEEPEHRRDVVPVLELLRRVKPDIVTVALDPEASGPDTHYKVLQAVSEALRLWERESGRSDIRVLGYRNVWYRFHPSEATHFVPVSLNMMTLQHESFMNTYLSQREASFPSYEHKGPFSELSQRIQVEQYERLSTTLGRDWFYRHPSALIRATRGFAFIRLMSLDEFYGFSRELRWKAESV